MWPETGADAETVSVYSETEYRTTCPGHSMNPTVCVSLLSISRAVSGV